MPTVQHCHRFLRRYGASGDLAPEKAHPIKPLRMQGLLLRPHPDHHLEGIGGGCSPSWGEGNCLRWYAKEPVRVQEPHDLARNGLRREVSEDQMVPLSILVR